jgi:hypothetical protein
LSLDTGARLETIHGSLEDERRCLVATITAERVEAVELPRYRTATRLAPEMMPEITEEADETYPSVLDLFVVFLEPNAT